MNDNKNDPQVWPEDLSDNHLPDGESVPNGNGEAESIELPPRPVPRAGMGHADAWREHENAGLQSDSALQTFEEPLEEAPLEPAIGGDAFGGDAFGGDAFGGDAVKSATHRNDAFHEDTPGYVEWADDDGSSVPPTPSTTEPPVTVPPLTLPASDSPDSGLPDDALPDNASPDPATVPELAPLATVASNGGGPPVQYSSSDSDEDEPEPDPNAPSGAEESLWSHLGELRTRILYSIGAVFLASCVTWNYGQEISEWFARPIRTTLQAHGVAFKLVTLDPTEGFLVYFQITFVAAILISMPFTLFQMWRFLEPALTRTERRFSLLLLPFSVLLFFAGCALGYAVSPVFFKFFLMFQPPGTDANFSYSTSIVLLAKMVLVFGLCFQVPIITIFLNKIGIVSRNFLIDYWRHAVVVIFVVVAVLTPTWDPLTLLVCAGPPCVLYALSIWMVKWI